MSRKQVENHISKKCSDETHSKTFVVEYKCLSDKPWHFCEITDNCEEVTGYTSEDFCSSITGLYPSLIISEDYISAVTMYLDAIQNRRSYSITYKIFTKHGQTKTVRDCGDCIIENGEFKGFTGSITTIVRHTR